MKNNRPDLSPRALLHLALGTALLLFPAAAMAQSSAGEVQLTRPVGGDVLPGGQLYQSDIRTSFIFSKLIPFAIRYLIGLAAALAVIALMVGGYQYLTAYGSEDQHKKAVKTITMALIGLIVCITAYGIVALVASIQFGAPPPHPATPNP